MYYHRVIKPIKYRLWRTVLVGVGPFFKHLAGSTTVRLQRRGRRGRLQRLPTSGVSGEGCRVGIGEAALLRTAMKKGL
jgi:hypothetical protein